MLDKKSTLATIENLSKEIQKGINSLDKKAIFMAVDLIYRTYKENKTVFVCGNGGSATNSSHTALNLSKETNLRIKAISLTDNVGFLTAYGNDLAYKDVFSEQLKNLISKGDILIAISGSGNSQNIIEAVKIAKKYKAKTIGLLGFRTGGKLGKLVDIPIIVQSDNYGPIEDIHSFISHLFSACLKKLKQNGKN